MPLTPKWVTTLHFHSTVGHFTADRGGKFFLECLCKKMASIFLLQRYDFYHIHMEVKENAQDQNIMVGKSKLELFRWLPIACWYPETPPGHQVILLWYPTIPPAVLGLMDLIFLCNSLRWFHREYSYFNKTGFFSLQYTTNSLFPSP